MLKTDLHMIVCPFCGTINRAPAERLAAGAKARCGKCREALFSGVPAEIVAGAEFDRFVEQGSLPVLVDFWAAWCGPCKTMAPYFAAAARALEPRVRLLKVDTEALPQIAQRFAIRSIPTMVLLMHGREVARQSGVMDARQIEQWVGGAIARHAAGG
jgi:thioredoxin 2